MDSKLKELQKTIGISFHNIALLEEALTHRSYLNEHPDWRVPHNERLEFLGDAVLELAVTEELFTMFPDLPEGQLTIFRAALVNYQTMNRVAGDIMLEQHVLLSRGERADTSKAREVILANAIEAVIGAVYLDQGFDAARAVIKKFVMKYLDEILRTKSYKDAKSELQEIVQERTKMSPTYKVLEETGPAHRRTFRIGVCVGEELIAEGSGASKQEAELEAAREALKREGR